MNRVELCRALTEGDEAAWRQFVLELGPVIYAVAGRFQMQAADRDDLFQRSCLAVVRHIDALRDPERLASWTYGIALRLAIDGRRRRRPEGSLEEISVNDPALRAEAPELLEDLERLDRAAQVRDALTAIDRRCQRLLSAIYLEEPPASYEEICRRESLPLGSIGPTRGRCVEKLRRVLAERKLLGTHEPATRRTVDVSEPSPPASIEQRPRSREPRPGRLGRER